MKLFPAALCIAVIVAMSACKKYQTTFSLEGIQGTWTPNCGCPGMEFKFKGDSIFYADSSASFTYAGFVRNDTAFIICSACIGQVVAYIPNTMNLVDNNQKLYIGDGECGYDKGCTDKSYRRVY